MIDKQLGNEIARRKLIISAAEPIYLDRSIIILSPAVNAEYAALGDL